MGGNPVEIWVKFFERAIEGKEKSARENTKRIYGAEEKSVGKGKVEQMVVATVSELGILFLFLFFFWLFISLIFGGKVLPFVLVFLPFLNWF